MSVRSGGRKVSFDLLVDDTAGDELDALASPQLPDLPLDGGGVSPRRKRRPRSSKKKKKKKKKNKELGLGLGIVEEERRSAVEDGELEASRAIHVSYGELRQRNVYGVASADSSAESSSARKKEELGKSLEERRSVVETVCESLTVTENDEVEGSRVSHVSHVELRQRNVNGTAAEVPAPEERSVEKSSSEKWRPEANGAVTRLETMGSLDWKRVIADHPHVREASSVERSPLKYFMGEMYGGNSLRSTISVGNEKKRQRVYNTMFHVPLRCERLIIAGFFFCLDSFLSLLTIMPARILMTIGRLLKTRQFLRPSAAELSDFGCFIVLAFGVTTLQLTDISLIYHIIRGQGTIKLYVVYNVLEIFDKLCQSFGEDVLQVLFNSAEGLANCSAESVTFELLRFIFDEAIAVIAFIVHSFVLLAQAITLSTCIIAHNNALMALLISNNFAEIKSNVFKRVSKENLQNLVYYDIVERFHITAFVLFVLAQNILEAEGPWFESFFMNAMLVYVCELLIDTIKHAFLAKFNEIKPDAYSEFLEDLCKQTLNEKQPEERRQDLTFIPIAPACVVIRVLTPIYATLLPFGPLLWRLFWIIFWSSLTYIMLTICKILVGLTLRRLATWYLYQRQERKQHMD